MIVTQIRDAMKAAMKARDQIRLDAMRMVLSAFTNELVSKGRKPTDELTDTEALAVIKRLIKQRKDAAEQYTSGGRPELALKEMNEAEILSAYTPQAASRSEIEKVARTKMTELGITDKAGLGKLTGAIMKEFGGNADGTDVKDVLSELLK